MFIGLTDFTLLEFLFEIYNIRKHVFFLNYNNKIENINLLIYVLYFILCITAFSN